MTDLMETRLHMGLLVAVQEVLQTAVEMVLEIYKQVTWEVAMVMVLGIQGIEMQDGGLTLHKLLGTMEPSQMDLMVAKLGTVEAMVVQRLGKPNNSNCNT